MSGPSSTRHPFEFGNSLRNCSLVLSFLRPTAVERTPVTTMFLIFPPSGTRTQKPSEESQLRASDAIVKNSNKLHAPRPDSTPRQNWKFNLRARNWFGHRP